MRKENSKKEKNDMMSSLKRCLTPLILLKRGMIKIEYTKGQSPIFAKAGLKSFEDFFAYCDGEIVGKNRNRNREVIAITLNTADGKKEFFMKRFYRPYFKDMLFTIRNFGKLCSQAEFEWRNMHILSGNSIATCQPVCYGEHMQLGLEKKSFIITEKIKGRCMTDFVSAEWPRLEQEQKEVIIIELAKFVRKIHNAKIILPDLYLWHIYITNIPAEGEITEDDFAIIDLNRMRINVSDKRARIGDIGALYFSMSGKYFDNGMRELFFDAYINAADRARRASIQQKIKSRSCKLAGRRRRPDY
jgi:hypothetical protein